MTDVEIHTIDRGQCIQSVAMAAVKYEPNRFMIYNCIFVGIFIFYFWCNEIFVRFISSTIFHIYVLLLEVV